MTLSTIPTTRRERWATDFEEGRGPFFWAAVLLGSVGLYGLLVMVMALA
jgi:hypothetical protein